MPTRWEYDAPPLPTGIGFGTRRVRFAPSCGLSVVVVVVAVDVVGGAGSDCTRRRAPTTRECTVAFSTAELRLLKWTDLGVGVGKEG